MKRAVLEVELQGTRLLARLVPALPEDGPRGVVAAERDIDPERIRELTLGIARVLNRGTRWADNDQGSFGLLRRKGGTLFDALLPAPIKASLRAITGDGADPPPALIVAAPPALADVPWELLHTGFGFLGLTLAIGRADGSHVRGSPPKARAPLRMLVIADPRGDLIGSYYEGLTLRDELGQDLSTLRIDLRSSEVGRGDVLELVREYDIVHYAGHAEPEVLGGPRGWWLRDGVLSADAIMDLAGGSRFPQLVFVNACRSARDEADRSRGAISLSQAFVEAGAQHVIGTAWDVPDEPASGFAIQFHTALVEGATVGEAARRARLWVAARYGAGSIFWAAWVVLGDPGVALFEARRDPKRLGGDAVHGWEALPELAARVRGVASAAVAPVSSLDEHRHARWLQIVRVGGAVLCLVGVLALVGLFGGRRGADEHTGVRSAPSADFGPIERFAAAPLAVPMVATGPASALPALEPAPLGLELLGSAGPARSLATGEAYRVRWSAPDDGWVSVWRVDGEGQAHHLGPVLVPAFAATTVDLPGGGGWYTRTATRADRFVVAWRRTAPSDPGEIVDDLRTLAESDRGFDAVREALEDHFDRVVSIDVPLADGASEGVFR